MLVVLTGMSGSGKSTIARRALQLLTDNSNENRSCEVERKDQWVLISQDDFFKGEFVPYATAIENGSASIEEPEHIDFDKLRTEVKSKLDQGLSVIVEGHALFSDKGLKDMANDLVYIDVKPEICMERRISRKSRSAAEIEVYREYFMKFVVPAHERNQAPTINSLQHRPLRLSLSPEEETCAETVDKLHENVLYTLNGEESIDTLSKTLMQHIQAIQKQSAAELK